jgi:hypothetical protein
MVHYNPEKKMKFLNTQMVLTFTLTLHTPELLCPQSKSHARLVSFHFISVLPACLPLHMLDPL